jgi:SAM-dependent methyltransferase
MKPIKLAYDPIIYSLETPKYHLLELDAINKFSGWVFYFGKLKVDSINVYNDKKQFLGNFRVDKLREDISAYVPSIPAAKTCGFAFDIKVETTLQKLIFELVFDDASKALFFEFDIAAILRQQDYFSKLRERIASISMPDSQLVYLTQGHYNVEEYKNSIIPGIFNMHNYLEQSGVDLSKIDCLLDFGCGSGRLLAGWYVTASQIELHGCDFNEQLMTWAQNNLSHSIKCIKNDLIPPLPYSNDQFELIYLISVFTHLSLDTQKKWIEEFKRILKVGGYILLSLHGEAYVRNAFWNDSAKIEGFLNRGFVETDSLEEGSNSYGTFHAPAFVEELFQDFQLVGYFQNGRIEPHRTLFQIAQSQDVYIFKYCTFD